MSYGFGNIGDTTGRVYLKEAGLHQNVKFLGLKYEANESWEAFDIELETADGKYFRERTFGADINKVYPKAIYKNGVKERDETKQEAYERVKNEINKKLFYLAQCFVDRDTLIDKVSSAKTLKELVEGASRVIGEPTQTINMLTIWKNSDARQKSNLIIADKIKWCEPFLEGKTPTIKLSTWQANNQTIEKYPYKPDQPEAGNNSAVMEPEDQQGAEKLPF